MGRDARPVRLRSRSAQIFLIGLLLGWLRWASGSTLLTIVLHMLANLAACIQAAIKVEWMSLMPLRSHVHHPRLDRRRAAHAEDVLQRLRGGEHARLAARRADDLQADRQILAREAAGQRQRRAARAP